MNTKTAKSEKNCPRSEIAAYIDGELSAPDEIILEAHFAVCETCQTELNDQKKLLCALDFALEDEREIEVPKDFAKIVATRAESRVSGLRNRRERSTALFLSLSIFLFVLLAFGAETEKIVGAGIVVTEKLFALISFCGRLIFDISFGTVVILRSLTQHFIYNPIIFFALGFLVSILYILRIPSRINRFWKL